MISDLITNANLKLDAEGSIATAKLHSGPENLYWKNRVLVWNNKKYNIKGMRNFITNLDLPIELAACLNVGDVLGFIQEEDPESDVFLKTFDYPDRMRAEYIRWKEFLGDESLGIYIFKKEYLLGSDTLNIHGFYYDEVALDQEVELRNSPMWRATSGWVEDL